MLDTQIIGQAKYGDITLDNTKKEVVEIWMLEKKQPSPTPEMHVIEIQRENIIQVIATLIQCL